MLDALKARFRVRRLVHRGSERARAAAYSRVNGVLTILCALQLEQGAVGSHLDRLCGLCTVPLTDSHDTAQGSNENKSLYGGP